MKCKGHRTSEFIAHRGGQLQLLLLQLQQLQQQLEEQEQVTCYLFVYRPQKLVTKYEWGRMQLGMHRAVRSCVCRLSS